MDRVGGQKIRKKAVRYCPFTPWLLQSLSQICHQTEGENRRCAVPQPRGPGTLLFSFTAIRGQTADFLWQIAKGPRSLNKLSHGCFVLVKLLGPQRRFPLLIFLAIKTCLKLVVGNAVDFLPPLCFLVGLGNLWTPIKGTWQTFLPRI